MKLERHGFPFSRQRLDLYAYFLIIIVLIFPFSSTTALEPRSYYIATATPGGTFYRVGYAISALVTEDLAPQGISMTAINTDGSYQNLKLLLDNQAQFALLQGFIGAKAKKGQNGFDAKTIHSRIQAIAPIWQNVEHFCVRSEYIKDGTGTIDDLILFKNVKTGEKRDSKPKFSLGKPDSGTQESGRYILKSIGIEDPESLFELVYLDYATSAEELIKGNIVGMNTPAGVPVAAVKKAFKELKSEMNCLNFNQEHFDKINSEYNLWAKYQIKPDVGQKDVTYSHNDKIINTIAQTNILVVLADVNEENVCKITKLIYDNEKFFRNIHASTKDMYREDQFREKAISALPFDLHPGAKRYYDNKSCTTKDKNKSPDKTE